jgi:translation initiation factor 1 (eIF-1/SUI1)
LRPRSNVTAARAKNGIAEIQGDRHKKIVAWFTAQGRKAKAGGACRAGGNACY